MADPLLDDLIDWLRIPSISTGGGDPRDLRRAAEWVCRRIDGAGGRAELQEGRGNPIAYGELTASEPDAPTVLIYGHYDVQGPGDLDAWQTPPFDPDIRDGRIYARGACDDKGNFLPLLHVACALAHEGALPVNVRAVVEGEEEAGSGVVTDFIRADEDGADVAIVFDSAMADAQTPAITAGLRGTVGVKVAVRTARTDLHSGLYGGTVLNALHVLAGVLAPLLPGSDGRVREELRAGVAPPSPEELSAWARLKPGDDVIAEVGGRPVHRDAGATFYERNWADVSLDVNEIRGGEARTVVPATAHAVLTVRLAAGQSTAAIAPVLERLLLDSVPDGAEVEVVARRSGAEPVLFPVDSRPMQLAAAALERACGTTAAFIRSGGSIPIVAELAARGIPTIVSGFALAEDDIHAPNESYRLESLRLGEAAARELYAALAGV